MQFSANTTFLLCLYFSLCRAFTLSNGLRALVIDDLKSLTESSQIDVDDDGSDADSLPRDSEGEEETMDEDSSDSGLQSTVFITGVVISKTKTILKAT